MNNKIFVYLKLLRVNQWIKNVIIFTAIVFSGKLFDGNLFLRSLIAFFIFCLLSSTSYVLNDIIDYQYDKKHPQKKYRPIAAGIVSLPQATFIVFVLTLVSLIFSLLFSISLFFLSFLFLLLHFFYSLYLKKRPLVDIFSISFSFMIRAFAGEVATGYHIPIWLFLTISFGSLFMASVKRHAELSGFGRQARESLYRYNEHFLDFLTYTFGTATIIAYATYTYVEKLPSFEGFFHQLIVNVYSGFEARKWLMITIPLVVYGIARYAQLLYEKYEGERPEKIITTDMPLIFTIGLWGIIIVGLIYFL
jgi:decaprenyl-phosphate phosphoribosyltransferase